MGEKLTGGCSTNPTEGCFSHLLGTDLHEVLLNEKEAEEHYVEINGGGGLGGWRLRGGAFA